LVNSGWLLPGVFTVQSEAAVILAYVIRLKVGMDGECLWCDIDWWLPCMEL